MQLLRNPSNALNYSEESLYLEVQFVWFQQVGSLAEKSLP